MTAGCREQQCVCHLSRDFTHRPVCPDARLLLCFFLGGATTLLLEDMQRGVPKSVVRVIADRYRAGSYFG